MMNRMTRRQLLARAGALAVPAVLAACGGSSTALRGASPAAPSGVASGSPVAAGAGTAEVVELGLGAKSPNFPELLALFAQREPGIKIVAGPSQGGSGTTLARLQAEGPNTRTSLVFFGQADGPSYRDAGVLKPVTPAGADGLRQTDRDPNGLYYSYALWTPCFIYNESQLPQPPKSFAELLQSTAKLSYPNPVAASSGLIFLVGAIMANGGSVTNPEPGFEYLKNLRPKIATYTASGGESMSFVQKGEVDLGIHYAEANMFNKYVKDAPIGMVVPKEGMPLSALSVGVPKYAPQPEAALRFVEFLLSREAQELLASRYYRPAVQGITIPPEIVEKYPENYDADYPFDWDSVLPYQKEWLERWNREIK